MTAAHPTALMMKQHATAAHEHDSDAEDDHVDDYEDGGVGGSAAAHVKYIRRTKASGRIQLQRLWLQVGSNKAKLVAVVCAAAVFFAGAAFVVQSSVQTIVERRIRQDVTARKLRAAAILRQRREEQNEQDEPVVFDANTARGGSTRNSNTNMWSSPSVLPATLFSRNALKNMLSKINADIRNNVHGGIRWVRPEVLPPLPGTEEDAEMRREDQKHKRGRKKERNKQQRGRREADRPFFHSFRNHEPSMAWETEWEQLQRERPATALGPIVDYTSKSKYSYPPKLSTPPKRGGYPRLQTLESLMRNWDQDEDFEGRITETLIHFNYSNPVELEWARKFRDAELPFKLVDVPEVAAATLKWTDEYVSSQFDVDPADRPRQIMPKHERAAGVSPAPQAHGYAQESPNNYFAFYNGDTWDIEKDGVTPVRNSDWSFEQWSTHARYADASRLSFDQPHFYWQSGVDREERHAEYDDWTFISRDLPSFSSPEETFFVFHPENQKGIQCRFGERGVVAAQHYDSGRNMIAMVTGAKRYILAPPTQCSKLGLWPGHGSPLFRHSLLNYAHFKHLRNNPDGMTEQERLWMARAAPSLAVETVLKAGEVLYIPSFWFHYIISIQKSAQCNVRSGIEEMGSEEFGGYEDVAECVD